MPRRRSRAADIPWDTEFTSSLRKHAVRITKLGDAMMEAINQLQIVKRPGLQKLKKWSRDQALRLNLLRSMVRDQLWTAQFGSEALSDRYGAARRAFAAASRYEEHARSKLGNCYLEQNRLMDRTIRKLVFPLDSPRLRLTPEYDFGALDPLGPRAQSAETAAWDNQFAEDMIEHSERVLRIGEAMFTVIGEFRGRRAARQVQPEEHFRLGLLHRMTEDTLAESRRRRSSLASRSATARKAYSAASRYEEHARAILGETYLMKGNLMDRTIRRMLKPDEVRPTYQVVPEFDF